MPRVSGKLARLVGKSSRLLLPLLRATKDLTAAKNELRWIQNELPKDKWVLAVKRRGQLEPLQYILGSQPFGPLDIKCEPGVLIPRWETEEWTSALADSLDHLPSLNVLDACTGTGCIPLLLKHRSPSWSVKAFDVAPEAVELAKLNSKSLGIDVGVHHHNLFDDLPKEYGEVDLVTSNPPYIPLGDYHKPVYLDGPEKSVRMYEPELALVGHLKFYKALIEKVVRPLNCSGFVFELGYEDQVEATIGLLGEYWEHGKLYDSAGKLRCVLGWRKGSSLEALQNMVNGKK